jgi:Neprosin
MRSVLSKNSGPRTSTSLRLMTIALALIASSCSKSGSNDDLTSSPKAETANIQDSDAAEDKAERAQRYQKLEGFVNSLHKDSFVNFRKNMGSQEVRDTLLLDKKLDAHAVDQTADALDRYYTSLPVTTTIQVPLAAQGAVVSFDCVPIRQQPALAASFASGSKATLERPPKDPDDTTGIPNGPVAPIAPTGAANTPSADPKAYVVDSPAPACPSGTVPIRRTSLPEAVLEPGSKGISLMEEKAAAVQGKSPSGSVIDRNGMRSAFGLQSINIPESVYKHRYAHAYQAVDATGVSSRLNVWQPLVLDADMSLSQVWVTGGSPNDSSLQTVEAGWQVYNYWETNQPALFVYQTSDNYGASGCYVTRCGSLQPARAESFRITNSKLVIGKPISSQSSVGGAQAVVSIKWIRNAGTGSWWLKVNDDWIGYYPVSTFSAGALATKASYIDFGGETTGVQATSQMGSGHYAEEGKGKAGFQNQVRYLNATGKFVDAQVIADAPDAPCYTIAINGPIPPEDSPGTYFYFGGPGVHHDFSHSPPQGSPRETCTPPPP